MFLPSGRVHAIGAGLVIFEIQQNSDTTYRVFDWNRVGLDGKPRALHVRESLASINFNDFEPPPIQAEPVTRDGAKIKSLVRDPLFSVEIYEVPAGTNLRLPPGTVQILAVVSGKLAVRDNATTLDLVPGEFGMLPATLPQTSIQTQADSLFLRIEAGASRK